MGLLMVSLSDEKPGIIVNGLYLWSSTEMLVYTRGTDQQASELFQ